MNVARGGKREKARQRSTPMEGGTLCGKVLWETVNHQV
jgi:hypothetical protein